MSVKITFVNCPNVIRVLSIVYLMPLGLSVQNDAA